MTVNSYNDKTLWTFYLIIFLVISRAAGVGNPEALIKLGLAHLYNEGSKYWAISVYLFVYTKKIRFFISSSLIKKRVLRDNLQLAYISHKWCKFHQEAFSDTYRGNLLEGFLCVCVCVCVCVWSVDHCFYNRTIVYSLLDGHLWDWHYVCSLERCLSCRQ